MLTVGRKHTGRRRGEYVAVCAYCGVAWHRSKLKRDANGYLSCPDDQAGRVERTLEEAALRATATQVPRRVTEGISQVSAAETTTPPWWANPLGTPSNPSGAQGGLTPPAHEASAPIDEFAGVVFGSGGGQSGISVPSPFTLTPEEFPANQLALLHIFHNGSSTVELSADAGVTLVQIATVSDSGWTSTLYRTMVTSTVTSEITVTITGTATTFCHTLFFISGVNTTGTFGSGAVGQVASQSQASGTSTTVTLGAFSSTFNATWGNIVRFTGLGSNTSGSGFTQLDDGTGIVGSARLQTQWKNTPDTTVDWTHSNGKTLAIALEIVSGA